MLTYDDGPSSPLTGALLDLLRRRGASATFFAKGVAAAEGADQLDRIVAEGHEIGCHSHAHLNAWRVRPGRAWQDALRGFDTLARWVPNSGLYRPPNGKVDVQTWLGLERRGARLAWWTLDSGDTWSERPSVASVCERVQTEGGGVVLMHDMHSDPSRQRFVLELTEALLDLRDAQSLSCMRLGELIDGEAAPSSGPPRSAEERPAEAVSS